MSDLRELRCRSCRSLLAKYEMTTGVVQVRCRKCRVTNEVAVTTT